MSEEERKPCDVDDVVCQMEVPAHLKGLKKGLGNEQFLINSLSWPGLRRQ